MEDMSEVRGYSAAQIRAAERPLLDAGVPLMQRAAAGLAAEVRRLIAERDRPSSPRVLLLVGSGDNGGDTLYAGAELARNGIAVVFVPTGSHLHEAGAETARAAGARQESADDVRQLAENAPTSFSTASSGSGRDRAPRCGEPRARSSQQSCRC